MKATIRGMTWNRGCNAPWGWIVWLLFFFSISEPGNHFQEVFGEDERMIFDDILVLDIVVFDTRGFFSDDIVP